MGSNEFEFAGVCQRHHLLLVSFATLSRASVLDLPGNVCSREEVILSLNAQSYGTTVTRSSPMKTWLFFLTSQ